MSEVIDPMGLAVEQARKTMNENIGGPFGGCHCQRRSDHCGK